MKEAFLVRLVKASTWLCLGLLSQVAESSSLFSHSAASINLTGAHKAYLRGDYAPMMDLIRAELEAAPDDRIAKANVLDLMDRAFGNTGKKGIDLNWRLPKELSHLQINDRRVDDDGKVKYMLHIRGEGSFEKIDQLKVVKFPNTVLIDKRAGLGRCNEFGTKERMDHNNERITCWSPDFDQPIEGGLFYITVELDHGKHVDGWFVLSHMRPTSSPKISAPQPGENFFSGSPTFQWSSYLPASANRLGKNFCTVFVTPHQNQLTRWFLRLPSLDDAHLPETFIADTAKVGTRVGATHLDSGNYVFNVRCDETRRLGDLILSNERAAIRSFRILRP